MVHPYLLVGFALVWGLTPVNSIDESAAAKYMAARNEREAIEQNKVSIATWNYQSNFSDYNKKIMMAAEQEAAEKEREEWKNFQPWALKWKELTDPYLKRQFYEHSKQGISALNNEDITKLLNTISEMSTIYSTAKVNTCTKLGGVRKCQLSLEPELTEVLEESRNSSLLREVWTKWRDVSGRQVRQKFIEYVKLLNKAAKLNGFSDAGAMWREPYEDDHFPETVAGIWTELKPLYQQLHAYVRRKLREQYGENEVPRNKPIPAHLLGNMWSQTWGSIDKIVSPYPNKNAMDVTKSMVKQGYTPLKMFKLSEKFFVGLNLTGMTDLFWKNTIMEKPNDREMVCHASAWDFYDGRDYRIKMCATVTVSDLFTIHHEMGHVEYYMQYKNQPQVFRTGANPGFHEAVGDSLALSVMTPEHLYKIGLLPQITDDHENDINFLMEMALQKVAFLPFGYLIDNYRWKVFSGEISSDKLNEGWWKLRERIQGISAPVSRSEEDFDPGAKYHVVANTPYIRYFVSFVIQFQFHKAMCLKAKTYDPSDPTKPLHRCDVNESAAAGNALADMLKLGASRPWPDALEALTGTRKMDASVLREYFKPLEEWLKEDNQRNGEEVGWEQ